MVAVKYWSLIIASRATALAVALAVVMASAVVVSAASWADESTTVDLPTPSLIPSTERMAAQLATQLANLHSYTADFTQIVLGGRNELLQQSHGRVHIARPDRFKWVVAQPYPQTLVTVADKLYLYDPDLAQLTVEALDAAMAGTPALILTGNSDQIDALFQVIAQDSVYSLYPKDASALFAKIDMHFNDEQQLSQLDIVDHLGQLTQVSFTNIVYNAELEADEFQFILPPGTDVIGELHKP